MQLRRGRTKSRSQRLQIGGWLEFEKLSTGAEILQESPPGTKIKWGREGCEENGKFFLTSGD